MLGVLTTFPSNILKKFRFSISRISFITYNASLYNILYIKTSIFLTLHLNILSLSFFIIFYSSSLCLSFLCASLSQPSTASHHSHPPILQSPHPPTITATNRQPDLLQPQTTAEKKNNLSNVFTHPPKSPSMPPTTCKSEPHHRSPASPQYEQAQ